MPDAPPGVVTVRGGESLAPGAGADLSAAPCEAHEVSRGGRRAALLTWWSVPREFSYVELAQDGPVLPVDSLSTLRGPAHPQRLVREANVSWSR